MSRLRELGTGHLVFIMILFSAGMAMVAALATKPAPKTNRFKETFDQVQAIKMANTERVRRIPLERAQPIFPPPPQPATVPAPPPPAPEPPAAPQVAQEEPQRQTTHQPERSDICAKYGGHRVDYGKHWRCVYGDGHGRRRRR